MNTTGESPRLEVSNVEKSFGQGASRVPVLEGVSFTVNAGQSVALTGESGSGKSTLLHLIGGLDRADRGEVFIDGRAVQDLDDSQQAALRRDEIGLVFQQFNLIPSLTVQDNLAFHARLKGIDPAIGDLASRLGLDGLMSRYPEQLSGGQQQRVAIGRALASRPRLILADEPTGNLDEETGDAVFDLLGDAAKQENAALVVVTHSERLANKLDRRLHLRRGRLA